MAFEDYKELDLSPEKATQEEVTQLAEKYGVSDFYEDASKSRKFLYEKEQKDNLWTQLWNLLVVNFPDDSVEDTRIKFKTLKNYDQSWYGKKIVLYAPNFRGTVLRVGIQCEGTDKAKFFITDAGIELMEGLKL